MQKSFLHSIQVNNNKLYFFEMSDKKLFIEEPQIRSPCGGVLLCSEQLVFNLQVPALAIIHNHLRESVTYTNINSSIQCTLTQITEKLPRPFSDDLL